MQKAEPGVYLSMTSVQQGCLVKGRGRGCGQESLWGFNLLQAG